MGTIKVGAGWLVGGTYNNKVPLTSCACSKRLRGTLGGLGVFLGLLLFL